MQTVRIVWSEYIYCLKVYTPETMSTWITSLSINWSKKKKKRKAKQTENHLNNHRHWYSFMVLQQWVHQLNFPGSLTVGLADINPATSPLFVTWLIISGLGRAQPTWEQLEVTDHIRVCLSLETKIKPCDLFKLIREAATQPRELDRFPTGPPYP